MKKVGRQDLTRNLLVPNQALCLLSYPRFKWHHGNRPTLPRLKAERITSYATYQGFILFGGFRFEPKTLGHDPLCYQLHQPPKEIL